MRNDWLQNLLAAAKPAGKSKSGLAEHLGLAPSRITEIIAGRRRISTSELLGISTYLAIPETLILAYVLGGDVRPAKIGQVLVRGTVHAGSWREALEWPIGDWRPAPVAPDSEYGICTQFGLEVAGPSMDRYYPHGSVVVCVSAQEIAYKPASGDHVVVVRQSAAGVEATVKELELDRSGRFWLWPRSSDPNFQQPWRLPVGGADEPEGSDIRITALVIGSYTKRPSRQS